MTNLLQKKSLFQFLYTMARIREAELYIAHRYPEQEMKCPTHLSIGQEFVAASLGMFSKKEDIFVGNYRSHGHYLAKGGSLYRFFAELLGKEDGCCRGMGGSMHMIDLDCNFQGTSAIVGSAVPIACGLAYSLKYKKQKNLVVVFFGDSALEEGVVYESINFAALHNLPIIFVCENNRLAVETPIKLRNTTQTLYKRVAALRIKTAFIEQKNIHSILKKTQKAYEYVYKKQKPIFLEFDLKDMRLCQHVGGVYKGATQEWWKNPISIQAKNCVIAQTAKLMLRKKWLTLKSLKETHEKVLEEMVSNYEKARTQKQPDLQFPKKVVYASGLLSVLPSNFKKVSHKKQSLKQFNMPTSRLVNPF